MEKIMGWGAGGAISSKNVGLGRVGGGACAGGSTDCGREVGEER